MTLNKEITRQELVLRNLYIQRYSLLPVSRLPTETLASIFVHCARDYHYEHPASGYAIRGVPTWVNVSYVCRHWRDVALDCPTLWTYIFTTSQHWTQELLARSKQASLKIYVNPTLEAREKLPRASYFVEQVMNHADRIQELRLQKLFSCREFLSKLSPYAPRLRNLEISTLLDIEDTSEEWPSVLFEGNTPALRILTLSRCPVPWYSFTLSGLTTLSLHYVPTRFQQNTVEFLAILSGMQDLVHLYLEEALASARDFLSSGVSNATPKTNLSRLSHLLITAPLSTVVAFLSCVDIPLRTELRLGCQFEAGSTFADFIQLSNLLVQRFSASDDPALAFPTVRSLVIHAHLPTIGLIFSASERECHPSFAISRTQWGHDIPIMVSLDCRRLTAHSDADRIMSDICCSIVPSTSVQSLYLINPPFSSGFWRKMLGRLPGLRHIKLSQGYMPDIASILSSSPSDCMENHIEHIDCGSNQIFAPVLEELDLHDLRFSTHPDPGNYAFQRLGANILCLYDALSTRQKPRGRLNMTQCRVLYEHYERKPLNLVGWWEGGHFHVVEDRSYGL